MSPASPAASAATIPTAHRQPLLLTASYCTVFVTLGLASAVVGPTLPGLAAHTASQLSQISFVFSARSLGFLLGSLFGGRLYDRLPGHLLMAGALLILTTVLALLPVTPYLWLLLVLMLVAGVLEGSVDVGGNTLLIWLHRERVAPFMNALHFAWGFGALLSPIIVAQVLLATRDINGAYWILALLLLPVALWLLRAPPAAERYGTRDAADLPIDYRLVALICVFFFLYVGAEVGMGGWIFTYAWKLGVSSEAEAAYLTSAFWGALTAGRLLSIPVAARFSERRILTADVVGCLACAALLLTWTSLPAIWIGTLGMGLSMSSLYPITLALAGRHMALTGRITGLISASAGLGAMFFPWFIGQVFEPIGPRVTMVVNGGALLAMAAVFVVILRHTRPGRA